MSFASVGKYRIYYVDEGEGFPLVLIHGLAGDHTAWKPQIEAFRARDRVVAFDNRGAGQSTQVDEAVTTADLAQDTLALMDALGISRAHIVGRSMGGSIVGGGQPLHPLFFVSGISTVWRRMGRSLRPLVHAFCSASNRLRNEAPR